MLSFIGDWLHFIISAGLWERIFDYGGIAFFVILGLITIFSFFSWLADTDEESLRIFKFALPTFIILLSMFLTYNSYDTGPDGKWYHCQVTSYHQSCKKGIG